MIGRLLHLALPTTSTGLVRLLQLAILAVLTQFSPDGSRDVLVAGFGLISSFAMLTDSGAGNFLLSTPAVQLNRPLFRRAVWYHFLLSVAGGIVALSYLGYAAGGVLEPGAITVLIALATSLTCDSTCRILRTPMLTARRDMAYSLPELALFATKAPIVGLAAIYSEVAWLLLLPLPSLVVLVLTAIASRRYVVATGRAPKRVIWRIAEFGWTGTLSASYSQAPLLIGTALLPLPELATLAVAFRVVQALDFLPGTLSLQLIPRVRDRATTPLFYWLAFAVPGAVIAVAVVACVPLIAAILGGDAVDPLVFALVAASFAPKSGNYAVVAYLMGTGRIRVRLWVTTAVSIIAFTLSAVAAATSGVAGVAIVPLAVELLFALACGIALPRSRPAQSSV
jgi:hypothetical protein